jgi:YVTN family beta-propeller protein
MPSPPPTKAPLFAYITDQARGGPHGVAVVDTANNVVVATLPLGTPTGIVSSPDGNVFVTIRRSLDDTGFIAILDPASHTVVARIPVAEIGPDGIVITPDGRRAYATSGDKVFVVDTAAKTVIATVLVGGRATGIAISPDGKYVYVASGFHTVSVLATDSNAVIATIQCPGNRIAVAPDGKRAYVSGGSGLVQVLDTASNTIAATFAVGNDTSLDGVAFSPDGKHAYIAGTAIIGDLADILPGSVHARMVVIDTATNTVEHAVPIPRSMLMGVAVSPDGKHVYFVGEEQIALGNQPGSTVGLLEVFDTATNSGHRVHVGGTLMDITVTPARR